MGKILSKRIFREFKSNALKYIVLAFMIAMALFMVVSIVVVAETIMEGVRDYKETSKLEDGQFVLFTELSQSRRHELEEKGITIEDTSYIDYPVTIGANDADLPAASTLRVFAVRKKMNLLIVEEGRIPAESSDENEIFIEKIYARYRDIRVGDFLEVGGEKYRVVGIGATSDYDVPYRNLTDFSSDSKIFGTAFINRALDRAEIKEYRYSFLLNGKMTSEDLKQHLLKTKIEADDVRDPYFHAYWNRITEKKRRFEEDRREFLKLMESFSPLLAGMPEKAKQLTDQLDTFDERMKEITEEFDTAEIDNLTLFLPREDNPRIEASTKDTRIDRMIGLLSGVVVMILFTYIISIFVVHNIEADSAVIGTLYALGARKWSILANYLALPVIVTFVGGVIGTSLGLSPVGVGFMSFGKYTYFSLVTIPTVYPAYLILYGIAMPPFTAFFVNYMVINKKLSKPALRMLRNEQRRNGYVKWGLKGLGYIRAFQIRQMCKELRASIGVVFGIFLSLLIFFMGVNADILCKNLSSNNKADTKFQHMYLYKYPPAEAPEGGEACVSKTLNKEIYGITFNITLLGIDEDNPYFSAKPTNHKGEVVVSSALSSKFGLYEGDTLVLHDKQDNMLYAFKITDVVQYSAGFYAFMDIDAMRDLFDRGEDDFDIVLSGHPLDIPTGMLYSEITKADIDNASDIFTELLAPIINTMIIISVIVFVAVMLLMMNMMIERSGYDISLLKVFGYRNSELKKLYLDGNFFVIAFGTAISLPLSKFVMDLLYPYLVANVASEVILTMRTEYYFMIYFAIMVLYFVLSTLLTRKLQKVSVTEVLKQTNQ